MIGSMHETGKGLFTGLLAGAVVVIGCALSSHRPQQPVRGDVLEAVVAAISATWEGILAECGPECKAVLIEPRIRAASTFLAYPATKGMIKYHLDQRSAAPLLQKQRLASLRPSRAPHRYLADTVEVFAAVIDSLADRRDDHLYISVVAWIPRQTYVSWVIELVESQGAWVVARKHLYHRGN